MTDEQFESFWEIYSESFPEYEKRDRAGQLAVLTRKEYAVNFYSEADSMMGFIAYWDIGGYYFVEHIAIAETGRGRGIGSILMNNLIQSGRNVVLEVEPPVDDTTLRRIKFYERLGFHLNQHHHIQPPLQADGSALHLKLMSFPDKISVEDAELIEKSLRDIVYDDR
ncbi:GNAT family N-acetyltransferase [Desulfonatronum sp. SC1]|uniref:GNAT family N-acetyltransferase n=1 Tax=Desulfonatronum sp. SC1 TaxID=2109626 RepID=UPI000D2FF148|nr:GNAT family N-acetyltransferase [Desulfonatronum sp. SC1]PTN38943.1 N-acetyltransferase [Desulfonatronum sp. SC1]